MANYFGEGASHSARVKAQAQLSKIFGMETVQQEQETQIRRVMVAPMFSSTDEWGAAAAASQRALKESTFTDV